MTSAFNAICGIATVLAAMVAPRAAAAANTTEPPALVVLQPGALQYWASGEFTRDGTPIDAPHRTVTFAAPVSIMTHEVSVGEYDRCVA